MRRIFQVSPYAALCGSIGALFASTTKRIFLIAGLFHVVNHIHNKLFLIVSQKRPFIQQLTLFLGQWNKLTVRKELTERHAKRFTNCFQC